MLVEPMFYVIFYDVAFPRTDKYAMKKRINYFKFMNLTDGILQKEVELDKVKYRVIQYLTFSIVNSVDNTLYLVCDIEKINI